MEEQITPRKTCKRMGRPKKREEAKGKQIFLRVTAPIDKLVNKVVEQDGFSDRGEYVRHLIRKDFERRGLKPTGRQCDCIQKEPVKEVVHFHADNETADIS